MQVTLEKGQKSFERKLIIVVPAAEIETELKSRISEFSQHASLPGFRPGKVKPEVIKDRFGKALREEVIQKVIDKSYKKALEDNKKLNPISQATVEMIEDTAGQDVKFSVSFEVMPELDPKTDGLEIEEKIAEVTDADLAEVLSRMQKQHATFHESNKAAKNDDRLTIDFDGFINGEAFKGGSAKGFNLVLGAGQMIAGFESGLIGLKAGEEKDLDLTFPAEYHSPDLAGKPVVFKIKVEKVESPTLPELDDKFATQYNLFTMEELRVEVRQNMNRELNAKLKSFVKNQVMDALLNLNEIDAPENLIAQECKVLAYQAAQQAGLVDQKTGKMKMNIPSELFQEAAQKRVKSGILMISLIEKLGVKADKDAVEAALDEYAQVFEDKEEVKRDFKSKPDQMANFHQQVLEDGVINKILDGAKVKKKKVSFFDVIDQREVV
jgi:trigger factor